MTTKKCSNKKIRPPRSIIKKVEKSKSSKKNTKSKKVVFSNKISVFYFIQ